MLPQNIISKAKGAAILAQRGATPGERAAATAALGRLVKRHPELIAFFKAEMGAKVTPQEQNMTMAEWRAKWMSDHERRKRATPQGRPMTPDEWRVKWTASDDEKRRTRRQRAAACAMGF